MAQQYNEESKAADLIAELATFTAEDLHNDPTGRARAIALSKKLTTTLENPVDRAVEYIFKPYVSVAIRMAVGLNLFEHISTAKEPISSAELSKLSGGEELLISRILRAVASLDFVEQTGASEWRSNVGTTVLAIPPIAAGYRCDVLVQTAFSGTKFLEETGWKNPSEPKDGFLQYANQTKKHLFEFMASQPALFADFNLFMGAANGALQNWTDSYDVKGRLLDGYSSDKSKTLLVDVGGGQGHDVQDFKKRFGGDCRGDFVLQDLPGVIEGIEQLDAGITKMGHDFFEPQPVKGARAYILKHILHDWSDKYCLLILQALRQAMTPGYSKLIILDNVLPDVGASELQVRLDLTMMTINSGMERSAQQFTDLLQRAGFKAVKTWSYPDRDGIVEAEVA